MTSSQPSAMILHFDLSPLAGRVLGAQPPVPAPPAACPRAVRHAACRSWENRARAEYTGVMLMRHLHGLLVDANAPMDLQEAVLRMQLDEQRHARVCAEVARGLGSSGELAFDLAELQFGRDATALDDQILGLVCGTFLVGEVVAFALLKHTLRALPPSPYREVLAGILADEALHGRFGALFLGEVRRARQPWLRYPGDAWLAGRIAAYCEGMAHRQVVDPAEVTLFEQPHHAEALSRLGVPPPLPFKAAYDRALAREVPRAVRMAGMCASLVRRP